MDKMKKNYSEQSKLVLYETESPSAGYLFDNIEAAIWLSKKSGYSKTKESGEQSIEVVLLPVGSHIFLARPLQPIKQIVRSLLRQLPEKWKEKLPARLQAFLQKKGLVKGSIASLYTIKSIQERLCVIRMKKCRFP